MKYKLFFTPYRLFLAHAVAKGAQLFAQSQIVTVTVDDELCLFETQLAAFVQQAFVHITGHHFGQEQVVAAQRDHLSYLAFQIDRAFFQNGAVGQHAAGGRMQAAGGKFIHITAAFHAAPVHRTHQRFGGQIDGKLSAFLNEVVAVALRPNADGHHAGLGADGARPADGDEVGVVQPAAGHQHRRFRVQQGTAPPALFAHP